MKKLIKKFIPESMIPTLKKIRQQINAKVLSAASSSRIVARLYYLFDPAFFHEYYAVLAGRKAYHDKLNSIEKSCALLRRNIHRLEKGLVMRPRRPVFAEGFIQETVQCYKNAVFSGDLESNEKKWAEDVLESYFSVVGKTKIIDQARSIYDSVSEFACSAVSNKKNSPDDSLKYKPYLYSELPVHEISVDQLEVLYLRRRSVRWYQDRQVPRELVQRAANLASLAPSACNRQPYSFYFCNEKSKAVRIAKCAGGTVGFADNLSAIVVVVGDLSAYPTDRDRHLIYIDGSLASMQFMLALEALGLSTCSINWPDVRSSEKMLRNIIRLEDFERVVMLLAVGYADLEGGIPYSQKKQNAMILKDISQ